MDRAMSRRGLVGLDGGLVLGIVFGLAFRGTKDARSPGMDTAAKAGAALCVLLSIAALLLAQTSDAGKLRGISREHNGIDPSILDDEN